VALQLTQNPRFTLPGTSFVLRSCGRKQTDSSREPIPARCFPLSTSSNCPLRRCLMALRSSWEGFLKLSLISVPVQDYNAAVPGGGDIHFHHIHRECGNRIRYQKVCPVHGEVSKEEIISGYEYEKGKYVEFDQAELSKLRAEDEKAINIDAFTTPDQVDPIYLSGKTFYLVPTGPAGQKPYALLHEVMKDKNRNAVATVVLSGHDETVFIRATDKLLTMTVLYYEEQVKHPSAFEDEVSAAKVSAQELTLAQTLV